MTKSELKEIIAECLQERENDLIEESFSDKDMLSLSQFVIECYEENMIGSSEFDVYNEGANMEMRDIFKSLSAEISIKSRELKKAIKSQDKGKAKKLNDEILKLVEKAEKEIKAIPSSAGSVAFGMITSFTIGLGRNIVMSLIPVANVINAMKQSMNSVKVAWENLKNGETTNDSINAYKTAILMELKRYKDSIKLNARKIDKM